MERNDAYRDRSVLIHGKFNSAKWSFQDHVTPPITTASAFRLRSAERGAEGERRLAEIDLWEVSLVTFPMLPEARVNAKHEAAGEAVLHDLAAALEEARRMLAGAAGDLDLPRKVTR